MAKAIGQGGSWCCRRQRQRRRWRWRCRRRKIVFVFQVCSQLQLHQRLGQRLPLQLWLALLPLLPTPLSLLLLLYSIFCYSSCCSSSISSCCSPAASLAALYRLNLKSGAHLLRRLSALISHVQANNATHKHTHTYRLTHTVIDTHTLTHTHTLA